MATEQDNTDLTQSPSPAKTVLQIPASVRNVILPPDSLPIVLLMRFSILPGPCPILSPELYHPEAWISIEQPSSTFQLQHLQQLALPPIAVVRALEKVLLSKHPAVLAGFILAAHQLEGSDVPRRLPLWVVTYWKYAYRVRVARQTWKVGVEWAQHWTEGCTHGRKAMELLKQNLAYLGWDDTLRGTNLSKYRTFRSLEFDLVNGHCETLGGIAYINNNHYTFIVICPSNTYVGYRDSMHADMPKDLCRAVLWWITRLIDQGLQCNKNVPVDQWLCRLPITSQALYNSFLCGMLAVNALTHHYIPNVELVEPSRNSLAIEQIAAFNDICWIHLDALPTADTDLSSFTSLSINAQFTFEHHAPTFDGTVHLQTPDSLSSLALSLQNSSESISAVPVLERQRSFNARDSNEEDRQDGPSHKRARRFSASFNSQSDVVNSPETKSLTPSIPPSSFATSTCSTIKAIGGSLGATMTGKLSREVKKVAVRLTHPAFLGFKPITREELHERTRLEGIAKNERRAKLLQREEEIARRQKEKEREGNRVRKAQEREWKHRLAASLAVDKEVSKASVGTKIWKLQKSNDISEGLPSRSDIAEESQPFCQLKRVIDEKKTETRGRKKNLQLDEQKAKCVNWSNPLLWHQIDFAARSVGYPWSPKEIVSRLQKDNPIFMKLDKRRISEWRDTDFNDRLVWTDAVLKRLEKKHRAGGEVTRVGVFHAYPELTKLIVTVIQELRKASTTVDVPTTRAVMIGYITQHAPEIFEKKGNNGRCFKCSEAFLRAFLRNLMDWSVQKSTRAGQKVPVNADILLKKSFLCASAAVRDGKIQACFIANTDQTQCVYSHDTSKTWTKKGEKQIAVAGKEEKRAFILVVGLSQSGDLLPFQAIYQGANERQLLPKKSADPALAPI
ncbi:hypothetical protein BC835DRAFT_1412087 [Cytidiella melzeri]|nr:hypothetical protein BC835DRAFT_1412087 [Cytidiella melzeri]